MHLEVHVVAEVVRVASERRGLDGREVDHAAELRLRAGDGRPDAQGFVRREVQHGHDEPRAAGLAAELRLAWPEADVQLIKSSGGVLEVSVDGKLVFSKRALGRHAQSGEVAGLVKRQLA